MAGTVEVRGLSELRSTLDAAGTQFANLDRADARAADVIIAGTRAPRLTGRLQASIRRLPGEGAVIGSDLPYARVQEGRFHYLRNAVTSTAPQWIGCYEQDVSDICDTVKGE